MKALVIGCLVFLLYTFSFGVEFDGGILSKGFKKFYLKTQKGEDVIVPVKSDYELKKKTDFNQYLPEKVISKFPQKFYGSEVALVPVEQLYFLPFKEFADKWSTLKNIHAIIIGDGVYDLETVWKLVGDSGAIKKKGNTYTIYSPIVISPNGTLVIKDRLLRLDTVNSSVILAMGKLFVSDSTVTAWNTKSSSYSPQPEIEYENANKIGATPVRPFILGIKEGRLILVNSTFKGLGYRGTFASFGVSLNSLKGESFKTNNSANMLSDGCASAVIVGNTFLDNFMGFYSNNACESFFIGNYLDGNIQYGFDPHDYSKNTIFSYNYVRETKIAHGVIFSRGVTGEVSHNIIEGNGGAGVMMDRESKAFISDNLILGNKYGGISLLESDGNIIDKNILIRNDSYGIYNRNSLDTYIKGNEVFRNFGAGVEITNFDISYQIYRNLEIDKYRLASSGWIENNRLGDNFRCDIKSSNGGAVGLSGNVFTTKANIFCEELQEFLPEILNTSNKGSLVINGYGDMKFRQKSIFTPNKLIEEILYKSSSEGNMNARTAMGLLESAPERSFDKSRKWFETAATLGDNDALSFLGTILLKDMDPKVRNEGLLLLAESAVTGDRNAQYNLYVMPFLTPVTISQVEESIKKAIKRVNEGKIVDCEIIDSEFCCNPTPDMLKEFKRKVGAFNAQFNLSGEKSYRGHFYKNVSGLIWENFRQSIETSKKVIAEKNAARAEYYKLISNKKELLAQEFESGSYYVTRFLNKSIVERNRWDQLLKTTGSDDFVLIGDNLSKMISDINRFRINKLDSDKILKNIRGKYFE